VVRSQVDAHGASLPEPACAAEAQAGEKLRRAGLTGQPVAGGVPAFTGSPGRAGPARD
jgi:hypothetical protein